MYGDVPPVTAPILITPFALPHVELVVVTDTDVGALLLGIVAVTEYVQVQEVDLPARCSIFPGVISQLTTH